MQQAEDLCIVENEGIQGLISYLIVKKRWYAGNSNCGKVKLADPNLDSNYDDEEYVVPDPMKESSIVEVTSNEENRVVYLSVLIPSEQSIHKEVIHFLYEKQDDIFVQVCSLGEFVVDDRNVSFGFQEQSKVFPLMTDECDEKHDNLVAMSYEYYQQYIQIVEDHSIEDCHSDFSSHVSCFELFFQEEICWPTCSEFCEDQETILVAVQQVDQPKVKEDIQHPCESLGEKEDNYCVIKRKQIILSPLSKDEID